MPEAPLVTPFPMPAGPVGGPAAWCGPEMDRDRSWVLALTAAELDELDGAIHAFESSGRDLGSITAATFPLPVLGPKLAGMLHELQHGRGFALLRGFDVSRYSIAQSAAAYLGVGAHLGSFRSQNARGHLLGHVKDLGLDIRSPTVRYYQTNRKLEFHTDSCDVVGLLCLKTAKWGGESRIASSITLHDEMLRRRPDLRAALFTPMPTDRRGEVPPGMKPWFDVPVFSWHQGQLTTIYAGQYIRSAQANFPEAPRLTALEHEAIDLLDEMANDPAINLGMDFLPGDMQFVHNHTMLHSRGDFEDFEELDKRRHLLRLWLCPKDARPLPPLFAQRYGSLEVGNRGGIVTQETTLKFVLEAQ